MVRSLRKILARTRHRRRIGLPLIVLVAGLAIWAFCRRGPAPSPVERAMIGEWGRAETDPGIAFVTRSGGPISHPWVVLEFDGDHSFRQWIVSASDTSNSFVQAQGRWRVVDGVIRFEEPSLSVLPVVANAGTQIARWTGLPFASSSYIRGQSDIPFRLIGTNDLELKFQDQNRTDWRRLPGSFRDQARLSAILDERIPGGEKARNDLSSIPNP